MVHVRLSDGGEVEIRPLESSEADREALAEGVARLSDETRYRRFLSPTPSLTKKQVAFLTDIDHHDREALVAIDPETGGGIAVARYVRQAHDSPEAEFAIALHDDWQGRGLGTILMRELIERAKAEGIEVLTGIALATNEAIFGLVERFGTVERDRPAYGEVEFRVRLAR
jgi:GNAT superfamily N-acetyltransferase